MIQTSAGHLHLYTWSILSCEAQYSLFYKVLLRVFKARITQADDRNLKPKCIHRDVSHIVHEPQRPNLGQASKIEGETCSFSAAGGLNLFAQNQRQSSRVAIGAASATSTPQRVVG
ncbi:hypothetical protein Mapa_006394 [Marchantia paleacea]|nr:hypothetical protein Mapa_006394 [Marchantia paleacea]